MVVMREKAEARYIRKRKIRAFMEGIPFYLFRIFPIKTNKIVMWTLEGNGGFGDSPKYIAKELMKRKGRGKGYQIVWLTNHPEKEFPDWIRTVPYTLLNRAYHLTTAAWWVSNTRSAYGTKKRKKTKYLMTWHAIAGIKPVGRQRGARLPEMARLVSEYDSKLIDYVPVGNEWANKAWREGLLYDGEFIRTGVPRCDVYFTDKRVLRKKYRRRLGIAEDSRLALYAPTFRGGSQGARRSVRSGSCPIEPGRLTAALQKKFGGDWYVLLKLHPQLAEIMPEMELRQKTGKVIDVSQYADIGELIAASDVYISDYSSPIFEAAIIRQPAFLYIDDEEEYVADRGDLLFALKKLPFPYAADMDELEHNIECFDREKYEKEAAFFLEEIGVFEDGKASVRIADLIEERQAAI